MHEYTTMATYTDGEAAKLGAITLVARSTMLRLHQAISNISRGNLTQPRENRRTLFQACLASILSIKAFPVNSPRFIFANRFIRPACKHFKRFIQRRFGLISRRRGKKTGELENSFAFQPAAFPASFGSFVLKETRRCASDTFPL